MANIKTTFFDLPQELRDEIYRLAYVGDEDAGAYKIVPLTEWMQRERDRRRFANSTTAKSIPACPLYGMIVSEQFYNEASAAWMRSRTFVCEEKFEDMFNASQALKAHVTNFSGLWDRFSVWRSLKHLKNCANLRNLCLKVNDNVFDVFEARLACVHEFTDADFASMKDVEDLLLIRSLERITLVPLEGRLVKTEEEQEQLYRTVVALEKYLNAQLSERGAQNKIETPDKPNSETSRLSASLTGPKKQIGKDYQVKIKQLAKGLKAKPAVATQSSQDAKIISPSHNDCHCLSGLCHRHPVLLSGVVAAVVLVTAVNSIALWSLMTR